MVFGYGEVVDEDDAGEGDDDAVSAADDDASRNEVDERHGDDHAPQIRQGKEEEVEIAIAGEFIRRQHQTVVHEIL